MESNLLIPIAQEGNLPPIFIVPATGVTYFAFLKLARSLRPRRPVYVFDFTGVEDDHWSYGSIEELASTCLSEIKSVQRSGPYYIGGHCWGGSVAFEIASKLEANDDKVAVLILLESLAPLSSSANSKTTLSNNQSGHEKFLQASKEQIHRQISRLPSKLADRFRRLTREQLRIGFLYRANTPVNTPIVQLRTCTHADQVFRNWIHLSNGEYVERVVPGDTYTILDSPHVEVLAEALGDAINVSQSG